MWTRCERFKKGATGILRKICITRARPSGLVVDIRSHESSARTCRGQHELAPKDGRIRCPMKCDPMGAILPSNGARTEVIADYIVELHEMLVHRSLGLRRRPGDTVAPPQCAPPTHATERAHGWPRSCSADGVHYLAHHLLPCILAKQVDVNGECTGGAPIPGFDATEKHVDPKSKWGCHVCGVIL